MTELFYAEACDYAGLRDAIRARVEQLNISRNCLDDVAGVPAGYCGKILSQGEGKDVKRFGVLSLGLVLQAAGLKMLLVDDREALAKVQPMYEPRDASQVRLENHFRRKKPRPAKPPPRPARERKSPPPKRGKPHLSDLLLPRHP